MRRRLLDFLCCPKCGSDFKCVSRKAAHGEIIEGTLVCACGVEYPISKGIPRILPHIGKIREKTAESFSYEWKTFPNLIDAYKEQFLGFLGPHVKPGEFNNKVVLDAGCGTGRHAYWAAKWGAEVVAFDLGESVEVAAKNLTGLNVHIVQADIYNLPFKKEFDLVYSIGVLHHLPDGEKGFRNLLKLVKRNGSIFAWVYGKEGNPLLPAMLAVRKITPKLPLPFLNGLCFASMLALQPIIKIIGSRMNEVSFFNYLSQFGFRQNQSILFDQLLAPIAHYYTKKEFESWFTNAGLVPELSWRNENSWRGFAKVRS